MEHLTIKDIKRLETKIDIIFELIKESKNRRSVIHLEDEKKAVILKLAKQEAKKKEELNGKDC
jgi:low affinity Fe/Cu permease